MDYTNIRMSLQLIGVKSLAGNFSGLHLVCLMYVAFKSIALDTDIGFDLSKEYAAAQALHGGGKVH